MFEQARGAIDPSVDPASEKKPAPKLSPARRADKQAVAKRPPKKH
jgi:hypothetical protein